MVKNIYLDIKINLVQCQGAEVHLEVNLDHVVGIVVGVHWAVLKPVPINSARSKTCILTPRSGHHHPEGGLAQGPGLERERVSTGRGIVMGRWNSDLVAQPGDLP